MTDSDIIAAEFTLTGKSRDELAAAIEEAIDEATEPLKAEVERLRVALVRIERIGHEQRERWTLMEVSLADIARAALAQSDERYEFVRGADGVVIVNPNADDVAKVNERKECIGCDRSDHHGYDLCGACPHADEGKGE